jgi:hypothetical protein
MLLPDEASHDLVMKQAFTLVFRLHAAYRCRRSCLYSTAIPSVSVVKQAVPGGKFTILGDHSIGHSKKKKFIWRCVLFRTVTEIEPFECTVAKLLIRKRYYVLFLILFIVEVTNWLVYNKFSKIPPSTSMHFATRVRTWHVAKFILTFLYAGNSIRYAIEQFVPYTCPLFFCTFHSSSNPINKNLT